MNDNIAAEVIDLVSEKNADVAIDVAMACYKLHDGTFEGDEPANYRLWVYLQVYVLTQLEPDCIERARHNVEQTTPVRHPERAGKAERS